MYYLSRPINLLAETIYYYCFSNQRSVAKNQDVSIVIEPMPEPKKSLCSRIIKPIMSHPYRVLALLGAAYVLSQIYMKFSLDMNTTDENEGILQEEMLNKVTSVIYNKIDVVWQKEQWNREGADVDEFCISNGRRHLEDYLDCLCENVTWADGIFIKLSSYIMDSNSTLKCIEDSMSSAVLSPEAKLHVLNLLKDKTEYYEGEKLETITLIIQKLESILTKKP